MMIVSYLFYFLFSHPTYTFFIVMKESFTMKLVLKKMIEEIRYIANGNFNHKVSIVNHNYLEELASGVNQIVEQLKVSIDEERQAEQAKAN